MVIATEPFLPMAQSVAVSLDYPDARIVSVDHPIAGLGEEAIAQRASGAADAVLAAFLQVEGDDPE